jgi:dTDP-glucose pyrophosphorylase
MWGIIPAAGYGSRIQPLGFSKELLPIGRSNDGATHSLQPVINYVIERLVTGGASKLCLVASPDKSDIVKYLTHKILPVDSCYVFQPKPVGLVDAIFRPVSFVREDDVVMIGLPDTLWFPEDGFLQLSDDVPSLLMFPVSQPQLFDAVILDSEDNVIEVQVKISKPDTQWIWGAIKMPGDVYHALYRLWVKRGQVDEQVGSLINVYLAEGGVVKGIRRGESYIDVGTVPGYVEAVQMLDLRSKSQTEFTNHLQDRILVGA